VERLILSGARKNFLEGTPPLFTNHARFFPRQKISMVLIASIDSVCVGWCLFRELIVLRRRANVLRLCDCATETTREREADNKKPHESRVILHIIV